MGKHAALTSMGTFIILSPKKPKLNLLLNLVTALWEED